MKSPIEIREIIFQNIFAICFEKGKFEIEEITEELTEAEKKQIEARVYMAIENEKKINELIEKNLKKDWQIERLSKMDLALLKLAISELLYTDIPYKVTVNEVVELAKKYGESKSPKFINGLLASVIKQENIEG